MHCVIVHPAATRCALLTSSAARDSTRNKAVARRSFSSSIDLCSRGRGGGGMERGGMVRGPQPVVPACASHEGC